MLSLARNAFQASARRTFITIGNFSPLKTMGSLPLQRLLGPQLPFGMGQRRWKSRGNTYQPSTLKRKRRVGFLARARSKQGSKILQRRKQKGRWFLTH
ncbi:YDR115W [Zygosaccharomyces parabailii]|uniref:Large ribosomal subunit protein bL34m n=1 Tax=Zygosaccharomyces bailii (strain CLIB 213 / ATCC 58445 / CBS 680 / BCRC 21525 / NBRC 1098 / NCYC 1416 / NRRL Y-2227) TaxID=1333698 RepID=A0A8J2T443_ZYGB2|nr:YDR115W [Zygosaccharomyces parabailii]CDF88746.1 ZYBA0S03-01002g1_1 [Zygosaccharomyces bailii CLIB 213]SJM82696.1 related to 54S ribosomal protein L34, mitochondrial [Zygosaccharomyces bailii]